MSKPICEICGINDCIVYVERPQGTFCHRCNEKVDQILKSTLDEAMKRELIADLKRNEPSF